MFHKSEDCSENPVNGSQGTFRRAKNELNKIFTCYAPFNASQETCIQSYGFSFFGPLKKCTTTSIIFTNFFFFFFQNTS